MLRFSGVNYRRRAAASSRRHLRERCANASSYGRRTVNALLIIAARPRG
jgi:hypothetical protein